MTAQATAYELQLKATEKATYREAMKAFNNDNAVKQQDLLNELAMVKAQLADSEATRRAQVGELREQLTDLMKTHEHDMKLVLHTQRRLENMVANKERVLGVVSRCNGENVKLLTMKLERREAMIAERDEKIRSMRTEFLRITRRWC